MSGLDRGAHRYERSSAGLAGQAEGAHNFRASTPIPQCCGTGIEEGGRNALPYPGPPIHAPRKKAHKIGVFVSRDPVPRSVHLCIVVCKTRHASKTAYGIWLFAMPHYAWAISDARAYAGGVFYFGLFGG